MAHNSYLTAFSLVPSHATIPEGELWEGIPAQYKGPTPPVPPWAEKPWSEVKHACMTLYGPHYHLTTILPLHHRHAVP
jgi:hypothetical protein